MIYNKRAKNEPIALKRDKNVKIHIDHLIVENQ